MLDLEEDELSRQQHQSKEATHTLEKLMMIEPPIPHKPIEAFRSRPATRLLPWSALRHRSDHSHLLC